MALDVVFFARCRRLCSQGFLLDRAAAITRYGNLYLCERDTAVVTHAVALPYEDGLSVEAELQCLPTSGDSTTRQYGVRLMTKDADIPLAFESSEIYDNFLKLVQGFRRDVSVVWNPTSVLERKPAKRHGEERSVRALRGLSVAAQKHAEKLNLTRRAFLESAIPSGVPAPLEKEEQTPPVTPDAAMTVEGEAESAAAADSRTRHDEPRPRSESRRLSVIRDRLETVYATAAPQNLGRVDELLLKYKGNEEELLRFALMKYSKTLKAASESPSSSSTQPRRRAATADRGKAGNSDGVRGLTNSFDRSAAVVGPQTEKSVFNAKEPPSASTVAALRFACEEAEEEVRALHAAVQASSRYQCQVRPSQYVHSPPFDALAMLVASICTFRRKMIHSAKEASLQATLTDMQQKNYASATEVQ